MALIATACGSNDGGGGADGGGPPADAGATADGGPGLDASPGGDADATAMDARADTGPDVMADAGADAASPDGAATDARPTDARPDAGDGGGPDGGPDAGEDGGTDTSFPVDPTLPPRTAAPSAATSCESAPLVEAHQRIDVTMETTPTESVCGDDMTAPRYYRVEIPPNHAMTYEALGNSEVELREACDGTCITGWHRAGLRNTTDSTRALAMVVGTYDPDPGFAWDGQVNVEIAPLLDDTTCSAPMRIEDGDALFAQSMPDRFDDLCDGIDNTVHYVINVPAGRTLLAFIDNETDGTTAALRLRESCGGPCVAESHRQTDGALVLSEWDRLEYTNTGTEDRDVHLMAGTITSPSFFRLAVEIH